MAYAVITRDNEGTATYATALRALGLESIAMPVTRTEPMHDNLRRALAGTYDCVVCASARAANALVATRGSTTLPIVWAVGPSTAQVLSAAGIEVRLEEGVQDGVSLANAIIATGVKDRRILVPRAAGGRDELVDLLHAAGAIVEAVASYRTAPTPAGAILEPALKAFTRGQVAVCAVFAPSQVEALNSHVRVRSLDTLFAAIGETTAKALRDANAKRIVVATEPTPEGLANAVATVYPTPR